MRPAGPGRRASAPRPASTPAAAPRTNSSSATQHTEKTVWWEKNGKLTPEQFELLLQDFLAHAQGKTLYAQDLYGGADPKYRIKTRVFTELAWHSLFIRTAADPARPRRTRRLRSRIHHRRPAVASRPIPSATACARETVVAIDFTTQDHPDRRLVLCRRDEEVGVHHAELSICRPRA